MSAADGSVWGRDADVALLFEHHRQSVFSYCRRRLESDQDAEDALQTTFVYALRSIRRGARPRAETAWLYAIARNVCRERWRSSHRRDASPRIRNVDELADVLAAPEPEDDELFDLDSALEHLAERQREALLLREWRGLSYAEIAQRLDMSEAAVETLLYRARRALAYELGQGRHDTPGLWAPFGVLVGLPRRLWPAGATSKLAAGTAAVSVAVVAGGVVPRVVNHERAPVPRSPAPLVAARAEAARAAAPAVAKPTPPVRPKVIRRGARPVTRAATVTAPAPPAHRVATPSPATPPSAESPAPADASPSAPASEPASSSTPPAAPLRAPTPTEPTTSTVAQPVAALPVTGLPPTPVTDAVAPVVQTVTQPPVLPQIPQAVDLGPVQVQVQPNLPSLPSLPALP